MEWTETKPGQRWEAGGYTILREDRLHETLEAAIEDPQPTVFSWKAPEWLVRDYRSEPTLEAAMAAAEQHFAPPRPTAAPAQ